MHSEIYNEKYSIQVGGNQFENDELVKKSSQKSIWFHLDGMPSAHGILTSIHGDKPTKDAIKYVASIVKQHSKLKDVHRVKVQYIELSKVRRTNIPGKVTLIKKPEYVNI
jgi:predicted ribosome quality control (RQC) complex YloA/Tae2 family protein